MDLDIGAKLADQYNQTRKSRLELDHQSRDLKKQEAELQRQIIDGLKANGARSIGGQTCSLELKVQREPTAEDWDEIRKYIIEGNNWDIMKKSLNGAAVKLRAEDDIMIPGIGWYPVEKLSLHQLKDD
jgi:hypothetical protein